MFEFSRVRQAAVQAIWARLADVPAAREFRRTGACAGPAATDCAALTDGACYDDGVRMVEAQYENGVLRPVERLGLRSGERVNLMVVRRPDPRRWDLAQLSSTSNQEDVSLSEQGLADWANSLDARERH